MRAAARAAALAIRVQIAALLGCVAGPDDDHSHATRQAIVYGDDDRIEAYEAPAPFAQLAQGVAVALIAPTSLRPLDDRRYALDAPEYGDAQSLCPEERFASQPAAASCSGVLLAPDVVATAAHCLAVAEDGGADCTHNRYVFSYVLRDPASAIVVTADEVFDCKHVLGRLTTPFEAPCHYDIALVQLDRAVEGRAAARVRERPLQADEPVIVIGSPAGLPLKVDMGAVVVDPRSEHGDYFTLNSDTFAVSSGSPVFDAAGELVGVFARGRRDYDQDERGCQRVHRESDGDAGAYEQATKIAAISQLLDRAAPSDRPLVSTPAGQRCSFEEYLVTDAELPGAEARSAGCTVDGAGRPNETNGGRIALWAAAVVALRRSRRRTPPN